PLDDYKPTTPADADIPASALRVAQNGLRILHRLAPVFSGAHRPAGSYDFTRSEYIALIWERIYSKPERNRRVKDERVAVIADWLGISESSIDRYRKTHGIGIRDIRR